ncbi:hypothetical protein GmHk_07G019640 [Glycine max]|nr:hypothetical protein GmHk_07G019640 [Glycine max]
MDEKIKKKLEEATQSGSTEAMIGPPSPIRQHMKWKMARTKKTGQMTSEAAKEIAEKIDSLEEQASQGSFVPHGRQDVLTVAIGASVTIKLYFGPAPRTSHTSSSMTLEELEQLTQQIRDQLEESITDKLEAGPSAARVSIKENYVDPSGNDPDTGDSDKCGLYINENPPCLVALRKVYEGSITMHNIPLMHDQVRDVDAPIPVPIEEVKLVGQTLNTFLAWLTHLIKRLLEHGAMGPAKPADRPDHEVMWDATMFEVFNEDFPLYIKHEDLSEIAHDGQCLNIFVIQLWILPLDPTSSMQAGNYDVYGFLEPQSILRSGQSQFESKSYMKNWMQNSKWDVYVGAYLNGALKGLDDTPQPKSKAGARWIVVKCNRQKGSIECGYYVMHWMSTIILRSFTNNWEIELPLQAERLKALHIQWAKYYLKVRNQT